MLSAFAKCPSLLQNVSEIDVGIWMPLRLLPIKPLVLNFRTTLVISAFLRNVSHMPRLHTARFAGIKIKREHLALLFQSNSLHHLILSRCGLPRLVRLPPSHIRYLTLSLTDNYSHTEPLLRHCSANLEALDFAVQTPQTPWFTTLPLFPKLRKLKFEESRWSTSHLAILISLAPQLEHLEVYGERESLSGLSTLPPNLNRLSINQRGIDFGTHLFIHLSHLHITQYWFVGKDHCRGLAIPIIQHTLPNLTSLDLDIEWSFRNFALLLVRHLPNVTRLKMNISGIPSKKYDFDIVPHLPYFGEPGGPLARLYVNMRYDNKDEMETYKSWMIHTVLGHGLRLGGPYLQEVEMVFENSRHCIVLHKNDNGGYFQSIQRNEERVSWVYSHGQLHQGPCVGDRDFW
jgi:hypothetical protein